MAIIKTLASGMVRIVSCGETEELELTKRPRPADEVSQIKSFGERGEGVVGDSEDDADGNEEGQV